MPNTEIKEEIRDYVLVLESNYMDTIGELRQKIENVKKVQVKEKGKISSQLVERGDLEQIFVDSVEEVRKQVVRRRIHNEINAKKPGNSTLSRSV